ncbi:MAG: slr1659 superfamily regulator [Limnospira sp.]
MIEREIKGEDYIVRYDPQTMTVTFDGELSLGSSAEYEPIKKLLEAVVASEPETMTLDVKKVSFLNSAGISMLSKFVIALRKHEGTQLIVVGTEAMPWQVKSLKNLKKFLPSLQLIIE